MVPRASVFPAAVVLLIAAIGCGGERARTRCAAPVRAEPGSLRARLFAAETWMYQIQALDDDGALGTLAATDYPLLVVEPGHNLAPAPYDTAAIVRALRPRAGGGARVLLAYVDIGQAEDYRDYWQPDWVPPTADAPGRPAFLLTIDPDGWSGNYPVAYWDDAWKALWLGETGIIAKLADLGFDGVYLDWVEAYDDAAVRGTAQRLGVDPEREMVRFVEEIGAAGRAVTPGFLVVAQNAPYLIDSDPDRYAAALDALAVEDTWFHGAGDAEWDDPEAGDLRERHAGEWSTAARLAQYAVYRECGLPVFSVDYCVLEANAALVYHEARAHGLRPLVTRVALSRLTETPPPVLP